MLVLSRKPNETIEIDGGQIVVTVIDIRGGKVRLGIEAPPDIDIHRGEIAERIRDESAEQQEAESQVV